jgi:hypothetical protein
MYIYVYLCIYVYVYVVYVNEFSQMFMNETTTSLLIKSQTIKGKGIYKYK